MSITKLTQTDKFRSWLNKINEIIDSITQLSTDMLNKASKKHNSTETSYGLGTSIEYGHLKLSDSIDALSNINNGIAATPYAVKLTYDLAVEAKELAENSSNNNLQTSIISNDIILTENNNNNIILVNGNYMITIPNIKINTSFIIKNISNGEVVTIHPDNIFIDGSSENINLRSQEFIRIIQYSNTNYAIITDNRAQKYNLMDLNIENNVLSTDTF